ncbi:MAG: phosphatidate cytidylyltransferase [Acidimicrobiia bacterium]|nr:phosphatidate cytidylyltransferase [Acidimicrobiia bacterium]
MDDHPRTPDDEPREGFRVLGADGEPEGDMRTPEDPDQFGRVPVVRPDDPAPQAPSADTDAAAGADSGAAPELPHWTDPPTGEVPKIFSDGDDDLAAWSTVSSTQPRWRDQSTDWDDTDLAALGEDLPKVGVREDEPSDDFFTFDDATSAQPETYSVPRDPSEPHGGLGADPYADTRAAPVGAGRDMGQAVVVGVGIVAVAAALLWLGPKYAMALVVAVLVLASAELYATLRRVGYSPPTLVGLAAAAVLPLAAYWHGEQGLVLGLFLTLVVALLWYLIGVGGEHAVPNIGVTMLGVVYVGVLGSFAALLLRSPNGTGLLWAAVIGTVAYDISGLFIGRSMGRAPLSVASPNKTVEGTIGGMLFALVATVVITGQIAPFDDFGNALGLGLVLALVAPVGDLCESMLKRDLGVKDMGSMLPGHGGLLDRFDALLFALPATYYLSRVLL